ncbi:MAG: bifunctional 3-(3-hydroxy-phenyl)propionate/3-hydroxycinnamic acid hydroxylase [Pseudomonadota bacterium]
MQDPDVLIIGLGPVGAILAGLCARSGLSVKVYERDHEVYKQPRAIVMDHEVMRQMNFIDCAEDVLACSKPSQGYDFINADREILTSRPPRPGLAPTGYHVANLFHQPSMERAARAKLAELPNVDIQLGVELLAVEQNDVGVNAVFRTPEGLVEQKARYLIGCDGGRSLVRRYMDIQMEDLDFNEPWVVADVKILDEDNGLSANGVQLCDPARPTTCVPSGPGRHRWEFMIQPGETAEYVTRPETLRSWISEWTDPDKVELERSAVYRFHGLVAKRWRNGRVMVVGDAAHQMPPFMGQGLCAGARDACNLAWKLLAVSKGEAPIEFLDTVEQERIPHVKDVTRGAIAMGKTVCVTDLEEAARRDAQMMADHRAGKGFAFPGPPRIKSGVMDDDAAGSVFPEAFTGDPGTPTRIDIVAGYVPLLVLKDAGDAGHSAVAALKVLSPKLRVAALSGSAEGVLPALDAEGHVARILGDAPAILVKPDRIVFGKGDCPELADAWARYLRVKPTDHAAGGQGA